MVKLVVTDLIRQTIAQYDAIKTGDTDAEKVESVEIITQVTPSLAYIAHERLVEITQYLSQHWSQSSENDKSATPPNFSLAHILRGTQVYIPAKPVPEPKSQEWIDRMARLKRDLEEAEYQTMIREINAPFGSQDENYQTPANAVKELKHQMSTILNIFISVLSVAWALWYWTGTSGSTWSLASRTLLSLFGGLVVLIADVVMYAGYLTKIDTAKVTERSKKEITSVISTMHFGVAPTPTPEPTPADASTITTLSEMVDGESEPSVRKRK